MLLLELHYYIFYCKKKYTNIKDINILQYDNYWANEKGVHHSDNCHPSYPQLLWSILVSMAHFILGFTVRSFTVFGSFSFFLQLQQTAVKKTLNKYTVQETTCAAWFPYWLVNIAEHFAAKEPDIPQLFGENQTELKLE